MLRLVIFYQDRKAAGVYFGLLAKGGADNQVRTVVQDNLRGLLLTHAAVVRRSVEFQSKYARLNGSR